MATAGTWGDDGKRGTFGGPSTVDILLDSNGDVLLDSRGEALLSSLTVRRPSGGRWG